MSVQVTFLSLKLIIKFYYVLFIDSNNNKNKENV